VPRESKRGRALAPENDTQFRVLSDMHAKEDTMAASGIGRENIGTIAERIISPYMGRTDKWDIDVTSIPSSSLCTAKE
jgi:hypothetical protein